MTYLAYFHSANMVVDTIDAKSEAVTQCGRSAKSGAGDVLLMAVEIRTGTHARVGQVYSGLSMTSVVRKSAEAAGAAASRHQRS